VRILGSLPNRIWVQRPNFRGPSDVKHLLGGALILLRHVNTAMGPTTAMSASFWACSAFFWACFASFWAWRSFWAISASFWRSSFSCSSANFVKAAEFSTIIHDCEQERAWFLSCMKWGWAVNCSCRGKCLHTPGTPPP